MGESHAGKTHNFMKLRLNKKKSVRIVDSKTGAVTLGKKSQFSKISPAMTESTVKQPDRSEPPTPPEAEPAQSANADHSGEVSAVTAPEAPERNVSSVQAVALEAIAGDQGSKKSTKPAKPKQEIATLEQLIATAYARKGQLATPKPSVMRAIAAEPRLDEEANTRLLALADADTLLAVPRQLVLLSREIEGLPLLRDALVSFLMVVMIRHPAFELLGPEVTGSDLPEAAAMDQALSHLMAYEAAAPAHPPVEGKDAIKPQDLIALRHNAVHLLVTWWSCRHGLSLEKLAGLLQQAVWEPAARNLADESARLRALTEVQQPAALGWVSQRLRQQASDASAAQQRAERSAVALRTRVSELEMELGQANAELEVRAHALDEARSLSKQQLDQVQQQHHAERAHLQHDLEQLRGRLVRRLNDSIEMLEVGLTALRNKTPRTEVMTERAEQVVDALRAELGNLRDK